MALKPLEAFSVRKASRDGLSYKCRACYAQYAAAWRTKNPDAFKNWAAENKDHLRAKFGEWRERNKAHVAAYMAEWSKANASRVAANGARRSAAKLRATPAWADRSAIDAIYRQARELTERTGVPHEVDHYYPLRGKRVCGLHCEANLQILTMAENISKLNRMPEEWTGLRKSANPAEARAA